MRQRNLVAYVKDEGLMQGSVPVDGASPTPVTDGAQSRPRWLDIIERLGHFGRKASGSCRQHGIDVRDEAVTTVCPPPRSPAHRACDACSPALPALTRHLRFAAAARSCSAQRILTALENGDFPQDPDDEVEVWHQRAFDGAALELDEGFLTVNLRPVELALDAGEIALADRLVQAGASLPRTRWKRGDPVRGLLHDVRALYIAARRQPALLNAPDAYGWTFAHHMASSPLEQSQRVVLRLLKLAGSLRELRMDVTAHGGETPATVFAVACRLREPDLYARYRHVFDPAAH